MKEAIIRKILKCLALSKSANPHEAAVALERAQALMEKYDVSQADVELAGISGHTTDSHSSSRVPLHVSLLVGLIRRAFGCESIFVPVRRMGRTVSQIEFYGFGPRPEIAVYAFNVLRRQMERGRRSFLRAIPKRTKRANKVKLADNWAEGWAMGVWEKVCALAVSDEDRRRLAEWIRRRYGDAVEGVEAHRAGKIGLRGVQAFNGGVRAGSEVDLHRGVAKEERAMLR